MTDLRDALEAAMDGQEPAPAPETPATPAEPVQQAPDAPEGAPDDGRPREANGRFAAKPAEAQSPAQNEATPPAAPEAETQPIRPPEGLSAPVKAKWATLPRDVQEDFVRRERETSRAIQERGEKLNQIEPVARALDPIRDRLQMAGVPDHQYVSALVAADLQLRGPNKQQALLQLAQQYGIALPQAGQPGTAPQAQVHPEVAALRQQVAQLSQTQNEAKAQAEAARQAETVSLIQSFAADPKHPYFANVEQKMGQLLASGVVTGATHQERLQNAYEAACWADPTVRPLMQPAGGQAQAANAGDKAARARAAGSSIAGAPTPGGSPGGAATAPSVRAALEGAWTS